MMFRSGDKVYYRNSEGIQTGVVVKESKVKTIYEVRVSNGTITYFKQGDLELSKVSNADRIRSMCDKELMKFLSNKLKCWNRFDCKECDFYKRSKHNGKYYCEYSEEELMEWLLKDVEGGDLKCS